MWKKDLCLKQPFLYMRAFSKKMKSFLLYIVYIACSRKKFLGICQIDMKTQTFHPILLIHMVRQVKVLGKTCYNTCDYESVFNIYTLQSIANNHR